MKLEHEIVEVNDRFGIKLYTVMYRTEDMTTTMAKVGRVRYHARTNEFVFERAFFVAHLGINLLNNISKIIKRENKKLN